LDLGDLTFSLAVRLRLVQGGSNGGMVRVEPFAEGRKHAVGGFL
jgi:hypothetical protein